MRESANIYILTNPDTINGLLREPGNPLTEDLRTASEPEAYTLADKGIGDGNDPLFMIDLVYPPDQVHLVCSSVRP